MWLAGQNDEKLLRKASAGNTCISFRSFRGFIETVRTSPLPEAGEARGARAPEMTSID